LGKYCLKKIWEGENGFGLGGAAGGMAGRKGKTTYLALHRVARSVLQAGHKPPKRARRADPRWETENNEGEQKKTGNVAQISDLNTQREEGDRELQKAEACATVKKGEQFLVVWKGGSRQHRREGRVVCDSTQGKLRCGLGTQETPKNRRNK